MPALVVLSLAWSVLARNADLYSSLNYDLSWCDDLSPALMLGGWASIPMIGLAVSLRIKRPLTAWFLTIGLGLVLPALAAQLSLRLLSRPDAASDWIIAASLITASRVGVVGFQLCLGAAGWAMLHRQLCSRQWAAPTTSSVKNLQSI